MEARDLQAAGFPARLALPGVFLSALLGGCSLGEPPHQIGSVPPEIAYTALSCDTVGRAALHDPVSTGAFAGFYTVSPELPPGLVLNAETGRISGTPTAPKGPVRHTVIAQGPSGFDTVFVRLCVLPVEHSPSAPPWIEYESPRVDTVSTHASHPVFSLGGAVASYALLSALPAGLSLDAVTGEISGLPKASRGAASYRVIALGPGGRDTATLRLSIVPDSGGPSDTLPGTSPNSPDSLTIPNPPDTLPPEAVDPGTIAGVARLNVALTLEASAPYVTSRLIVTLHSDIPTDAVIRDTIRPGSSGFQASAQAQSVAKGYFVAPHRNWTVTVHTRDAVGAPMHADSLRAENLRADEQRSVSLALARRYLAYSVGFTLPDSAAAQGQSNDAKVLVTRIVMAVAGDTLFDSTLAGGYLPGRQYQVRGEHARAGAVGMSLYFIGSLAPVAPEPGVLIRRENMELNSSWLSASFLLPWTYSAALTPLTVQVTKPTTVGPSLSVSP